MKTLVICGATATGKTALAVECAKQLGGEIISADSEIIYRGLNIGTAKPTQEEMQGVLHHMIDIVGAQESFSVMDYQEKASKILQRIEQDGKVPVICGGTGFYVNSLLFDYSYGGVPSNPEVRAKYQNIADADGKEVLYGILQKLDPKTAARLHPNDVKRVVRALEIYECSGTKMSDISDSLSPIREYVAVAVDYPRDELYSRIDQRVDQMFAAGLVAEVRDLIAHGVTDKCQSMQAIGYKEVYSGIKKGTSVILMKDLVKLNTRHYAKRQITFFRKMPGLIWLKPEEATADNVCRIYRESGQETANLQS
ncbi:MAG: tRNA (adenosine(37)-N6)-dimethylallyltransferase MiaA [Clostridia bacterium]|nr:tRNA (adenosine(37)-N6)-dimethylallyltransferase MiaA [Clostridia bacterium]